LNRHLWDSEVSQLKNEHITNPHQGVPAHPDQGSQSWNVHCCVPSTPTFGIALL